MISEAGPPKTLFVPTNDAFAAVPGLADLDQDLLLEKHTVGNKLKYQNLLITADTRINTLADEFLTVDGSTGDVLVTPTVAGGPWILVSDDAHVTQSPYTRVHTKRRTRGAREIGGTTDAG